jgi:DNA-binding NtrC family response regulator
MSGYSADVMGKNIEFIRRTRSYFLQKPCAPRTLPDTVRQCLEEKERFATPKQASHAI